MFRSGQQVGIYTLITKLGRGGFGEVWLAEKRSQFVTKKVAVKLPHEDQIDFDKIRQEATLWEQASGHPNVLPIIDADVYEDQVVIVSEYADGGSLADKLTREEKLPLKESVELAIGILSGLEFLHNRQIIHRDIKPQNILLQGNTPRLADFGISRAMQTTMISSTVVGTDAYMSPESFDGKRNAQTDIWSVGVVLYQLLKGSLPFPQEHPSERMFAVLTKSFEPLPDEIPSELKRITQKALAKQPEHRYRAAAEMREDLQKALVGIAHPTMAKTEVLIKPDFAAFETTEPKVETGEPQFIPQTVPNVPVNTPANNEPANIPAPTVPSYVQESVVTEFKPVQTAAPNPEPLSNNFGVPTQPDANRKLNPFMIGAVAFGGFIVIIIGILGAIWMFSSSYPPELQSHIDEEKKKNPYYVYSELWAFEENKKYGFKNSKSEIVIPAKYEAAYGFLEGLSLVKLNGKFGYIDEKDNIVIPIEYECANHFGFGLAPVGKSKGGEFSIGCDAYNYIDQKGKIAISTTFEAAERFQDGLAVVKSGGKYGYIDRNGKQIVPFKYGYASGLYNGFGSACLTGSYSKNCGLIDKNGKELSPFKYDSISILSNGMVSFISDRKYGYLDSNGREAVPAKYDYGGVFGTDGYVEVELNGSKYRIDKSGNETYVGLATITNKTANTMTAPQAAANSNSSSYSGNSNANSNRSNTR